MTVTGHGKGSIYLTILVAMVLAIIPLPPSLDSFRPDWVMLVVIYWVLAFV